MPSPSETKAGQPAKHVAFDAGIPQELGEMIEALVEHAKQQTEIAIALKASRYLLHTGQAVLTVMVDPSTQVCCDALGARQA